MEWRQGLGACVAAGDRGRARAAALLTILDESGQRSRSHGLPFALAEAQAAALRLPLITRSASWADYTEAFVDGVRECAATGCDSCVFGDIDIDSHRRCCEDVSARAGVQALHPLWQHDRHGLVEELLARGLIAMVVVVRDQLLDRSFLGRLLDHELLGELERAGVDACGENGEFHTIVIDGPPFRRPLTFRKTGVASVAGCGLLRLAVTPAASSTKDLQSLNGETGNPDSLTVQLLARSEAATG